MRCTEGGRSTIRERGVERKMREKGRRDVLVITKKRENRKRVVVGEMQGRGRRGRRREREWLVVHGR